MRVGSGKIVDIDARIIAATNADLEKKVANGDFREDLFFRLNVIPLSIAPLRQRRDDILPLLKVFLGRQFGMLSPSDRNMLMNYGWPGNVRELENAAQYFRTMGQIPDYIRHTYDSSPVVDIPKENKISFDAFIAPPPPEVMMNCALPYLLLWGKTPVHFPA